jgi:hypothetical protein
VKKETKTNTWRKKRQMETRGEKRDKGKHVGKKETKGNTWRRKDNSNVS